ncbi:MAG: hypothetical protein ABIF08_02240 [Nanoarchaeota archaeon]
MPEKKYIFKLTGLFLFGIIALAITGVIFFLFWPIILLFAIGILALIFAFLVIWAIIYAAMMLGAIIYYFFKKPMKISEEKKGYSIEKVKEAGLREKSLSTPKTKKKDKKH